MTVETTDYTPEGKTLSQCTPAELLETINAIERDGILRLHAVDRLCNRILEEVLSRGLGLYEGVKGDDWHYAITAGGHGNELPDDAHYHALSARNVDGERRVWVVDGPYTKVRAEVRAFCDAPSKWPKAEPLDLSKGPVRLPSGAIVGLCGPGAGPFGLDTAP